MSRASYIVSTLRNLTESCGHSHDNSDSGDCKFFTAKSTCTINCPEENVEKGKHCPFNGNSDCACYKK